MKPFPATCPTCSARTVDVSWSDPTVPIYHCGSTPLRSTHDTGVARAVDRNVVPLELEDELALVLIAHSLADAVDGLAEAITIGRARS